MLVRACHPCASIKQKCDGGLPCTRCQRLSIDCEYARAGDKPNPTKYRAINVRRERTGCDSCKKRKKKCTGEKPKCSDCRRLNLPCTRTGRKPPARFTRAWTEISDFSSHQGETTDSLISATPISSNKDDLDSGILPDQSNTNNDLTTIDVSENVTMPLYQWLDPASIPSPHTSENGSNENLEDDIWANMAIDTSWMDDILASPLIPTSPAIGTFDADSVALEASTTSLQDITSITIPMTVFTAPMDDLTSREDRYLFHHYTHVVARSLCIASPTQSNPFLKVMLPLATASPAVKGALLALGACHLQHNGGYPGIIRTGLDHQTRAIAALNELIENGTLPNALDVPTEPREVALAAILLFCIIDIRQGNSTNWSWHITAAKNMIESRSPSDSRSEFDSWPFLLDLFEYVDSIITISKCKPPLIDHNKFSSEFEENGLVQKHLNPVFGVARPLFRLIGQVSALSNRRKYRVNALFDAKFRKSATVIDQSLRSWEPEQPLPSSVHSVQDSDLFAAIHCAQAIKYASILRLHQIVEGYRLPSSVPTECLQNILNHISQIPIGSPVESSLVFPLFIAGAVSLEPEDRMTVRCRWAIMERTIGFRNVAKGRDVLEKVWDEMDRDLFEASERGEEPGTNINWARIRWYEFSELVLF